VNRRTLYPVLLAVAGILLAAIAIDGIVQKNLPWNPSAASIDSVTTQASGEPVAADLQAGKPSQDFELISATGSTVHLSDYLGHPVLINYWATWCSPCREELPLIQARYEHFAPTLVVLAINAGEDTATVKNYVDRNGFTFQVLLDPDWKAESLFGIMAYPTSVFIDARGIIRARYVGEMSAETLDKNLKIIGVSE